MSNNPMGRVPENAFTRLQGELSGVNAGGARVGVASATPMPTVRSADLGVELPPLTDAERAILDAKAREVGALPPIESQDTPVPFADPTAERLTAREFLAQAMQQRERYAATTSGYMQTYGVPSRARTLPDFTRVETIDLMRGVIVVDGVEFPMPARDVITYRKYALRIAHAQISEQLREARRPPRRSRRRKNGEAATTSKTAPVQREPSGNSQEPA